jgi:uncharacterized protein YfaT (DUF1175 family)
MLALLLTASAACVRTPPPLRLEATPARLPADGFSTAALSVRDLRGRAVSAARIEIVEGRRHAFLEDRALRAAVLPGAVRVRASAPGYAPAETTVETFAEPYGDGSAGAPPFLKLDDDRDRRAFRDWFTFLAEAQFFRRGGAHPDITDCAALIRFACRVALRSHTGDWAASLGLPFVPALPPVRKYEYPFTPAGARLFRVNDGAMAEFADAETLRLRNAHPLGRDLRAAGRGDLLFYRQHAGTMPHHAMVWVGPSHFERAAGRWIVYHTGPDAGRPGEMRRVTAEELAAHPDPRWHPVAANPSFLGVYRWNILREQP